MPEIGLPLCDSALRVPLASSFLISSPPQQERAVLCIERLSIWLIGQSAVGGKAGSVTGMDTGS
jgi:hypothetical protein